MLIFAVLKLRLLQRKETEASFCFYNIDIDIGLLDLLSRNLEAYVH